MAKYHVNTDVPANVPDVHLQLKPGAEHQQSLPDDVVEEQLHHHDEQVGGFLLNVRWGGCDIFPSEGDWQTNTIYKCVKHQKI